MKHSVSMIYLFHEPLMMIIDLWLPYMYEHSSTTDERFCHSSTTSQMWSNTTIYFIDKTLFYESWLQKANKLQNTLGILHNWLASFTAVYLEFQVYFANYLAFYNNSTIDDFEIWSNQVHLSLSIAMLNLKLIYYWKYLYPPDESKIHFSNWDKKGRNGIQYVLGEIYLILPKREGQIAKTNMMIKKKYFGWCTEYVRAEMHY